MGEKKKERERWGKPNYLSGVSVMELNLGTKYGERKTYFLQMKRFLGDVY